MESLLLARSHTPALARGVAGRWHGNAVLEAVPPRSRIAGLGSTSASAITARVDDPIDHSVAVVVYSVAEFCAARVVGLAEDHAGVTLGAAGLADDEGVCDSDEPIDRHRWRVDKMNRGSTRVTGSRLTPAHEREVWGKEMGTMSCLHGSVCDQLFLPLVAVFGLVFIFAVMFASATGILDRADNFLRRISSRRTQRLVSPRLHPCSSRLERNCKPTVVEAVSLGLQPHAKLDPTDNRGTHDHEQIGRAHV